MARGQINVLFKRDQHVNFGPTYSNGLSDFTGQYTIHQSHLIRWTEISPQIRGTKKKKNVT